MSDFSQSESLTHTLTGPNVLEMSSALVGPKIWPHYISITFAPLYFKCNYICHNLSGFNAWYMLFFSCDQTGLRTLQPVRPSVRPSVHLSVCPWHLFHNVPAIVSSWNLQEVLPLTKKMSMQKIKVNSQRSRSQRSKSNLAVSGL